MKKQITCLALLFISIGLCRAEHIVKTNIDPEYNPALVKALGNAETTTGKEYVKRIEEVYQSRNRLLAEKLIRNQRIKKRGEVNIVMEVSKSGQLLEIHGSPNSKLTTCVIRALADENMRDYPPPPEDNYWVHFVVPGDK